jgi:hypothetical protein
METGINVISWTRYGAVNFKNGGPESFLYFIDSKRTPATKGSTPHPWKETKSQ